MAEMLYKKRIKDKEGWAKKWSWKKVIQDDWQNTWPQNPIHLPQQLFRPNRPGSREN
ncbi:hypothetical protein DPMN_112046 [Dreissena polymorpha]|uniref:Uncharacterized protein n=1 Tax=Dreissena polymorpha TaxID=45954 RepID=A0A9D4QQB2_DREPO|nr:hypothetical protein DPMN_112046 [Dreissena polymorpha]